MHLQISAIDLLSLPEISEYLSSLPEHPQIYAKIKTNKTKLLRTLPPQVFQTFASLNLKC